MAKKKSKTFLVVGHESWVLFSGIVAELTGSRPFMYKDDSKNYFVTLTIHDGVVKYRESKIVHGRRYTRLDANNIGLLQLLNPESFIHHFFH